MRLPTRASPKLPARLVIEGDAEEIVAYVVNDRGAVVRDGHPVLTPAGLVRSRVLRECLRGADARDDLVSRLILAPIEWTTESCEEDPDDCESHSPPPSATTRASDYYAWYLWQWYFHYTQMMTQ